MANVITGGQNIVESGSDGTATGVWTLGQIQLTIYGNTTASYWAGLDVLQYSGLSSSAAHVARYAQTNRYASAAGGNATNPELWAGVFESNDMTGLPSASTNNQLSVEMDLTGASVDNANYRTMLSGVLSPRGTAGYFEVGVGYGLTATSGAYAKRMMQLGGNYTTAVVDTRYAAGFAPGNTSLAPLVNPTVTTAVTSATTIAVSNVMPFTSDRFGTDIVHGSSATSVIFSDGQSANVSAYTITGTGPAPAGTLTLTSPITLAAGVKVYSISRTVWMATGQTIALDTNGFVTLSSDGTHVLANGVPLPSFGTPASATAPGVQGQIMFDSTYTYTCVSTNTWHRASNGSTW